VSPSSTRGALGSSILNIKGCKNLKFAGSDSEDLFYSDSKRLYVPSFTFNPDSLIKYLTSSSYRQLWSLSACAVSHLALPGKKFLFASLTRSTFDSTSTSTSPRITHRSVLSTHSYLSPSCLTVMTICYQEDLDLCLGAIVLVIRPLSSAFTNTQCIRPG